MLALSVFWCSGALRLLKWHLSGEAKAAFIIILTSENSEKLAKLCTWCLTSLTPGPCYISLFLIHLLPLQVEMILYSFIFGKTLSHLTVMHVHQNIYACDVMVLVPLFFIVVSYFLSSLNPDGKLDLLCKIRELLNSKWSGGLQHTHPAWRHEDILWALPRPNSTTSWDRTRILRKPWCNPCVVHWQCSDGTFN